MKNFIIMAILVLVFFGTLIWSDFNGVPTEKVDIVRHNDVSSSTEFLLKSTEPATQPRVLNPAVSQQPVVPEVVNPVAPKVATTSVWCALRGYRWQVSREYCNEEGGIILKTD